MAGSLNLNWREDEEIYYYINRCFVGLEFFCNSWLVFFKSRFRNKCRRTKKMEKGRSEAVYHQNESTIYENAGEGDKKELIGIQECKSECRKELISCRDEYNKLDDGKNEYKKNCGNPYRRCLARCWN